eukprot:TRINITY_DN12323_c0_g1_i2.p1 TRINITY_DN12323_c0_g1~~TRINITY_DN12323_c0_g1_i2.p1  ORF type:complete len:566 (+),score=167.42 TRINITY_DN12323_c0_g1_i2:136-1833(+)
MNSTTQSLESSKLDNLLHFLDEVESTPVVPKKLFPVTSSVEVVSSVRKKVDLLKKELQQRDHVIAALEASQQREKENMHELLKSTKSVAKAHLQKSKAQYESHLGRHQEFIDTLIRDKESLAQQCTQLADRIATGEVSWQKKLEQRDEFHEAEVKRKKQAWAAQEKVRREQWMAQETKRIKDESYRGIEVEVQKLVNKHQAQQRAAETKWNETLRVAKMDLQQQHDRELTQMRGQFMAEAGLRVQRERDEMAAQLRDQADRHEAQLVAVRTRLSAQIERASEQVELSRRADKRAQEDAVEAVKRQYITEIAAIETKYRLELEAAAQRQREVEASMRDNFAHERSVWQETQRSELEHQLDARSHQVRAELAAQQEEALDAVVQRLESEFHDQQSEAETQHHADMERLMAQHAAEMARARSQTEEWKTRCKHNMAAQDDTVRIREQMSRLESDHMAEIASLQSKQSALEAEITKLQSELSQAQLDAAQWRDSEQRSRDELTTVRQQLSAELQQAVASHEAELQRVHTRVREAVSKKDDTIADLNRRLEQAELLVQQQHQLLNDSSFS